MNKSLKRKESKIKNSFSPLPTKDFTYSELCDSKYKILYIICLKKNFNEIRVKTRKDTTRNDQVVNRLK